MEENCNNDCAGCENCKEEKKETTEKPIQPDLTGIKWDEECRRPNEVLVTTEDPSSSEF